ncbi:ATP-binding protein [Burkholderia ambifaria]|uniref:ATP-binding protein n=1 Tax=Burkholderia ambifaria TaxID=152480 RepID=UPI001592775C|nr:ATP-binding protein [Burkholderia ambifaria]
MPDTRGHSLLPAIPLSNQEQQWLAGLPPLRIGFDTDAAPYSFTDASGHPAGLSVDFATRLAARLGMTLVFVPYAGAQEGLELLREQHVSLLAAVNPAQLGSGRLVSAAAYYEAPLIAVTADGRSVFREAGGTERQRLLFDSQAVGAQQLAPLFPKAELIPASSTAEGLQALTAGVGEAFVGDRAQTERLLRQVCADRVRTITPLGLRHSMAMGFAPSVHALAPLVERALASLTPTERQTVRSRWLATSAVAQASWTAVLRRLWPALATLLAALAVLGTAYHRLRREVARRIHSEQALARQLAFNQALLRAVPYPLVAKDNDNRLIAANSGYESLAGQPLAAMLGKRSTEIGAFNAQLDARFEALSAQAIADRRSRHEEFTFIDRHQMQRSMLYWLTPFGEAATVDRAHADDEPSCGSRFGDKTDGIAKADGIANRSRLGFTDAPSARGGILAALVDISDVRNAEARARLSERRLREITSNLPAVVYKLRRAADGELSFLYVGGNPLPLFGLTDEQMMCDERAAFAVVNVQDQPRLLDALRVAAGSQSGFDIEFRVNASGGERWVQSRGAFSATVDGDAQWDGYWIDTTQAHRQAEALDEARHRAEAASAAKARFLATMSHEIRTPLANQISLLELLATTPLDARQAVMVRTAQTEARSLLQILGDVLDFSRIEAGHLTLACNPIDLRQVIEDVCATFSAGIAERGLGFSVMIEPEVATTVLGDALRIRQILLNLLGNATRFTPAGHIRVQVAVVSAAGEGECIELSVSDTGIGIESSELERVLEPFVQARDSAGRQLGGTGLGLSICRELVALMAGRFELTSRPGAGTTARVRLPLPIVQREPVVLPTLAGYRACVLVDCPELAARLTDILLRLGLQIVGRPTNEPDKTPDIAFIDEAAAAPSYVRHQVRVVPRALAGGFALTLGTNASPDSEPSDRAGEDVATLSACPMLTSAVRALCESVLLARPDLPAVAIDASAVFTTVGASQPAVLGGMRMLGVPSLPVLVAEDQVPSLVVIREQLSTLGYPYVEVHDGADALDALHRDAFAMLLTDCQMPGMDGPSLARRWREEEGRRAESGGTRRLPIIGITANSLACDLAGYRASGMDEVLVKPVSLTQLAEVMARHLPSPDTEPPATQGDDLLTTLRETYGSDNTITELLEASMSTLAQLHAALRASTDAKALRRHLHDLAALAHLTGYRPAIDATDHWRTCLRTEDQALSGWACRPPGFDRMLKTFAHCLHDAWLMLGKTTQLARDK